MASGQGVTDYITIDDFTPGIQSDFQSAGALDATGAQSSAKDGAARITDTYSCLAGPRGGLMPAFAVDQVVNTGTGVLFRTIPADNPTPLVARLHTSHPYERIIATAVVSPIYQGSQPAPGGALGWNSAENTDYSNPDSLLFMIQSFYDNTLAGDWRIRCSVRRYEAFGGNLWDVPVFLGPDQLTNLSQQWVKYGYGAMNMVRNALTPSGTVDYTKPASPALSTAFSFGRSFHNDAAALFPNDGRYSATYEQSTFSGFGPLIDFMPFTFAFTHQGRLVAHHNAPTIDFTNGVFVGGVSSGRFNFANNSSVEGSGSFGYSDYNSGGAPDPATQQHPYVVQFDQHNHQGYGVWQSLSSSELLLLPNRGPAQLVKGDIANPTVTLLKGMPEIESASNIGIRTPQGFFFGTRQGVYMYQGGDSAVKVSPNLDGWFWQCASMTRLKPPQPNGKFGYVDPYLIAPNNWVMDTRNGCWMRYFPTPDLVGAGNGGRIYPYIETSASGKFYAIPAGICATNGTPTDSYNLDYASRFKPGTKQTAWSWRSQPLIRTRGRRIKVREVVILAQADTTSTLAVTLYGYKAGSPTVQVLGTYTFTIPAASRPVQLSHPFNVPGGDIEVKMVAAGPVTVYRLQVGYNEGQTAHV